MKFHRVLDGSIKNLFKSLCNESVFQKLSIIQELPRLIIGTSGKKNTRFIQLFILDVEYTEWNHLESQKA